MPNKKNTYKFPLKIVLIASECAPFVKTGGLADVMSALPQKLHELGHEVIVVLPKYQDLDSFHHQLFPFLGPLGVWMGDREEWCAVYHSNKYHIPTFFIESNKYFNRRGLYHDEDFHDYLDNPRRFGFFTRAALQFCRDIGFSPDIVHVHDWQTALATAYLKTWHWNDPFLGNAASLLTIHNISYQGVYDAIDYDYLGLQWGNFTSEKFEDHGKINFLKGGIYYADMVNTVSPQYAKETLTPQFAHGLAPYLHNKGGNYIGILNGVDYQYWNPSVDRFIKSHYNKDDLSGKIICKKELQERFSLEVNQDIPLFGIISRFVPQKGLDIFAQILEKILQNMHVQFFILGSGEKYLENFFSSLPSQFPGRISTYIGYNEELSHWIEAGCDFFVMPSRFEPCGLNQIYSLRYGTLPIVRATGGLDDTVQQYNEIDGTGTGFKFWNLTPDSIYYTIGWAVSTYYDRPHHMKRMINTAMSQEFSWDKSASFYVDAYQQAIQNKIII